MKGASAETRSRIRRLKRIRLSGPMTQRERHPPPERGERHAARSAVPGGDVLLAARVVELGRLGPDDHVVARQLAEVDARLVHRDAGRGRRGQILHEEDGQALRIDLVDRAEREPVAVRVGQTLVHPRPARQAGRVELACRQHHLAKLTVDPVPVVVHRDELVVGADLLELRERVEQRLVVPQPHVLEGGRVVGDVGLRELSLAGEGPGLHLVQPERAACGGDVVLNVGRLAHLLVRVDVETLEQRRVPLPGDGHGEVGPDGGRHRPEPGAEGVEHGEAGAEDGHDHDHQRCGHAGVHVGVARAVEDRARGVDQVLRALQPGPPGQEQEQDGAEQRQVAPRAGGEGERAGEAARDAAGQQVHAAGRQAGDDDERLQQAPQELLDRQREDVEADLVPEEGVRLAEGHAVAPREPRLPLAGREQGDEDREERGGAERQPVELPATGDGQLDPLARREHRAHVAQAADGLPQVQPQPAHREHEGRDEEGDPRAQDRDEHLLVADLVEPEPVGVQMQQRGPAQHEQQAEQQ